MLAEEFRRVRNGAIQDPTRIGADCVSSRMTRSRWRDIDDLGVHGLPEIDLCEGGSADSVGERRAPMCKSGSPRRYTKRS